MNHRYLWLAFALALTSFQSIHAETLIPLGATWKFLDNGSDQGTAWRETAFSDSSWASGLAELGYGDGDERTVVSFGGNSSTKHITTYFRHTFNAPNAATYTQLRLRLKRDDGGVVYLNGTEIYRSANMGFGDVFFNTLANFTGENDVDNINVSSSLPLLNTGANVIAVEIHQESRGSSDISFDFELIAAKTPPPRSTSPPRPTVRASPPRRPFSFERMHPTSTPT